MAPRFFICLIVNSFLIDSSFAAKPQIHTEVADHGNYLRREVFLDTSPRNHEVRSCKCRPPTSYSFLQAKSWEPQPQWRYAAYLASNLKKYKTEHGYSFEDLEIATWSRDPWGAYNPLPPLAELQALDTDGDKIVSEEELRKFAGLQDSYCRNTGDIQYGCARRCVDGEEDFNGTFSYLVSKGIETHRFGPEVEFYKKRSDQYHAGAISLAQKRALALGLAQVVHDSIEGATCEFGVFVGQTSIYLHHMLTELQAHESHPLHLFDSFEGLPECDKLKDTGMCGKGTMAQGREVVKKNFQLAKLPVPPMHKGFFSDIPDSELPDKIAFAFLDCDLYPSMMSALQKIWPRLSKGGILMLHDYAWEGYPGTETAVSDFLKDKTDKVQLVGGPQGVACSIGMIRKNS